MGKALTDAAPAQTVIPAGDTVVVHARWTYDRGAQECMGVFIAARDFDPVAEHRRYAEAFPKAGHPTDWTAADRQAFMLWAVHVAKFLKSAEPFFLFLEPWPEKPAGEKVAHADR